VLAPLAVLIDDDRGIDEHGPTRTTYMAGMDGGTRAGGPTFAGLAVGDSPAEARALALLTEASEVVAVGPDLDLYEHEHDLSPLLPQLVHGGVVQITGPAPLVESVLRTLAMREALAASVGGAQ
jgi:hypothetical protein